jgi:TRAP-type uncharacterized transport system fused permease subunit
MGVPKLAAHMFIFYMGVTSDLTPPTCLSPFAAASIAGSPPMATAWQAMRLGAVLFIVPFMFVYQPALLLIGPWPVVLLASGTAARGVMCLAAALQGWLRARATLVDRALLLVAGFLFVAPWGVGDLIALGLLGATWALQGLRRAPEMTSAPAASLD